MRRSFLMNKNERQLLEEYVDLLKKSEFLIGAYKELADKARNELAAFVKINANLVAQLEEHQGYYAELSNSHEDMQTDLVDAEHALHAIRDLCRQAETGWAAELTNNILKPISAYFAAANIPGMPGEKKTRAKGVYGKLC